MQLKIEYLSKNDLKPYINNAKIHTDGQVEQIRKSIEEFDFNDPIAVWGENEIVEGHGRLLAAMEMDNIETVPVIRLDHLTDKQRKAYALAHNKLTMNTDFDIDKLADEMRMSKPRMKNLLLYRYGQRQRDKDGKLVVIKTNASESQIIERSDFHMWYYMDSPEDGIPMYIMLENSRYYDSKQMSILIDGAVSECKALGIETLPPNEVERLKSLWQIDIDKTP